jgi:hypothetical protein
MRRGGDRRQPVAARDLADHAPQPRQLPARLGHRLADAGIHLDLGAQQFRLHQTRADNGLAPLEDFTRRVAGDIAARPVHQQIFLLNSDREGGCGSGHQFSQSV